MIKCVEFIVNKFLELYKQGKHFMQFEQAWTEHIVTLAVLLKFITPKTVVWQAVVDKCKCSINNEDQRIMVSTLVYAVCDLMTDKSEGLQERHVDSPDTTVTTNSDDVPTTFSESKVNLYRYGGFALHFLLKKCYKHTKALY